MSGDLDRSESYGTWPSPISAETIAGTGVDFGHLALDGKTLYWSEGRPETGSHGVVVRSDGKTAEDSTPSDVSVLSLAYENGGGSFAVHDGVVFFSRLDDQRVYRQARHGDPEPITPEPETEKGLRYADFDATADGRYLYCVREDHDAVATGDADEPVATLVRITADGSEPPRVVASGHDFFAAPRLSPGGDRLAYLTWDHPRMPWHGTELRVADVAADGTLADDRVVMGGPDESVLQPAWRSDGTLHAVSDRTGWWNLYRREGDEWADYGETRAEYAVPPWLLGLSTYAFLDDGRVAAVAIRDGEQSLVCLDPDGGREVADLPYAAYGGEFCLPRLRSDAASVYVVAGGPTVTDRIIRWTPGGETAIVRDGSDVDVAVGYLSTPEHVTATTRDGATTHAFFYPPTNPDVEPAEDERPPLIVFAHGGPNLATHPGLDLGIQYFTSRGFAVADVNYRGSTGYGRPYREALDGAWGRTDVADCLDVARHLADEGMVDPDRIAVRGLSAGGYVALAALAFHDDVAAGVSYAGIADLERFAKNTHKFESCYAERLIGPLPEAADAYEARSPIHHVDGVDVPVLLLHGRADQIVPHSQAEEMAAALSEHGVPHGHLLFEDEGHLFHGEETIRRAHEAELAFYCEAFDLEPADEVPDIDLTSENDD